MEKLSEEERIAQIHNDHDVAIRHDVHPEEDTCDICFLLVTIESRDKTIKEQGERIEALEKELEESNDGSSGKLWTGDDRERIAELSKGGK